MTIAPRLTVDLGAIAANWRALDAASGPGVETAAVVKADAYGLGAARVAPVLAGAGARHFFVALPGEGGRLREALGEGPAIHILGGYDPGDREAYETARLRPVLNSAGQLGAWMEGPAGPAAVQLDSGMNRLGMEADELASVLPLPPCIDLVMSHLACADDASHPQNAAQRDEFRRLATPLGLAMSLAATGGTLMGADFHFALTRPGIGLYGGLPFADARPVVTLEAPILQVREVAPGEAVGYGATWRAKAPTRIATISAGYADGLFRVLSDGGAAAWLDGVRLPFAGRVSMDLVTLDVTHAPGAVPGRRVELLGPHQGIDTVAASAGTIGYEILTSLGARLTRDYIAA